MQTSISACLAPLLHVDIELIDYKCTNTILVICCLLFDVDLLLVVRPDEHREVILLSNISMSNNADESMPGMGEQEPLLGRTGDASLQDGKPLYHNFVIGKSRQQGQIRALADETRHRSYCASRRMDCTAHLHNLDYTYKRSLMRPSWQQSFGAPCFHIP